MCSSDLLAIVTISDSRRRSNKATAYREVPDFFTTENLFISHFISSVKRTIFRLEIGGKNGIIVVILRLFSPNNRGFESSTFLNHVVGINKVRSMYQLGLSAGNILSLTSSRH